MAIAPRRFESKSDVLWGAWHAPVVVKIDSNDKRKINCPCEVLGLMAEGWPAELQAAITPPADSAAPFSSGGQLHRL